MSRLPIAALAAALSTAAAAADGDTKLALRLPQQTQVLFRGVSSLDGAGGVGAQMMYPAPNAAGLLAAVLTHALISESTRNAEKNRIQEAADKVLAPYQDVLKDFEHRQLMQRALERARAPREKRLIEAAETAPGETIIESLPVFSMTQDQSAIVLDNSIVIYAPPASSKPVYKNTIRVVARPKEAADFVPFWTAGQGEALKAESARLFAVSLELALSDAAKQLGRTDAVHKTVRYHEGGSEKMERAQILDHACDRMVIRTLRDSLMSVPLKRTEGTPDAACASALLD